MHLLLTSLKYLWAAPYTAVGLLLGTLALALGGSWQRKRGAFEFFGGRAGRALLRLPPPFAFSAVTLGHVILAVDRSAASQLRDHEQVHVRQYERWGPLFLPAYLASSLLQLLRGRDPYRENHFERQAFLQAPPRPQKPDPARAGTFGLIMSPDKEQPWKTPTAPPNPPA